MANSRKDHKGRKLREGESWRKDGRYSYRYTDIRSGKRLTVYAKDLPELREKEKQIAKDLEDNILTDGAIKKLTLNKLFERYMSTRELKESTRANYQKHGRIVSKTKLETSRLFRFYHHTSNRFTQNFLKQDTHILQ